MTYERDLYMRRQEQDHDLLRMRDPSRSIFARSASPVPRRLSRLDAAESLENALSVAAGTRGFGDDMAAWSALAGAAQQAIIALRDPKLHMCGYCGDGGDVTRADGEWLGTCDCGAAQAGTRPQGQDGEAGLVRSTSDAVTEGHAPEPLPHTTKGI